MAATLVDTNVIVDVLSEDAEWLDWSAAMLREAGDRGDVVINPIIYAEWSTRYDRVEDVASALPDFFIGAHAAVAGIPLLTRDPRRYREYFPRLTLIAP